LGNPASIWPRNPFLAQHNRAALIQADHMGRSSCRTTEIELLGHGVLSLAPLPQSLAWAGGRPDYPKDRITQAREILANVNQITLVSLRAFGRLNADFWRFVSASKNSVPGDCGSA
jgi:hypothetical protein